MNPTPELRIPIIRLWQVFLVPLGGDIPDHVAEQLTTEVLDQISRHGPRGLVIDLSAVAVVDSHLCSLVANLAAAARLMGAHAIVSGISAEVAMTLQTMGISFRDIETTLGLEGALTQLDIGPKEAQG
jgi:rsbT antagonist protein RsbS